MTVSVSRRMYRPSGLSDVGRIVAALIDGGQQWLDWAMRDQQARYHFRDESTLVAGIQLGLHGTGLMLLPKVGLWIGPVKLMTFSLADLRTLAAAESGSEPAPDPAAVQAILDAQNLVRQNDLQPVPGFLQDLQVGAAPVFQIMSLEDQIALLDLRNAVQGVGALEREAAGFAVAQSLTPLEFIDYFRAYRDYSNRMGATDQPQRASALQTALDNLLPLTFAALDCPSVDGLVAPWEVGAAIGEWLLMGRQIGFGRVSLAFQQFVSNAGYAGQSGADAQTLVRDYLVRAQMLLNAAEIGRGQLGQNGASCLFHIQSDRDQADIELAPSGMITLRAFGRIPPAAALAVTGAGTGQTFGTLNTEPTP